MMDDKQLQQLERYADLEGTEIGEAINALLLAKQFSPYLNDDFNEAIEKELMNFLTDFETNWEIRTTVETHTVKVVDLVYKE